MLESVQAGIQMPSANASSGMYKSIECNRGGLLGMHASASTAGTRGVCFGC